MNQTNTPFALTLAIAVMFLLKAHSSNAGICAAEASIRARPRRRRRGNLLHWPRGVRSGGACTYAKLLLRNRSWRASNLVRMRGSDLRRVAQHDLLG